MIKWDRKLRRFRLANQTDEFPVEAICHYRVLERFEHAALIEARLVTGKRNQIRLQAQAHGHPLVGERVFTDGAPASVEFHRQALHAYRLSFRHPINHRIVNPEAPLPGDFIQLLDRLRTSRTTEKSAYP
jgi:23S rRNA pseudouridine1911/1915/1917 synthase